MGNANGGRAGERRGKGCSFHLHQTPKKNYFWKCLWKCKDCTLTPLPLPIRLFNAIISTELDPPRAQECGPGEGERKPPCLRVLGDAGLRPRKQSWPGEGWHIWMTAPIFGINYSGGFRNPVQFQTCPEVSRDTDHKASPQDPGTLPLPATEAMGRSLPRCSILFPHLYS